MKLTYYYNERDYGGPYKPLKLLKERFDLTELMRKSNDPDYPVNSATDICMLEEESGSILYIYIYPSREWIPSYMSCEKIKAEMIINIRNKSEEKRQRLYDNIEAILEEFDRMVD